MSCPYCNSPVLLNDWAGNHWYKCGTTKTFRSGSCVDREPLATELRNALVRIKRLEEALDTFTCVVELTPMKWNRALQEAFDMARAVLKAKEDKQ